MRYNIIYKKVTGLALAALTLTACTDTWDDHYDVTTNGNSGTLWQAIQQDSRLSNFARVIEATGYDASLGSSQVFTVFAPTNDAFSAQEADALIAHYQAEKEKRIKDKDNSTIKEFVQNHIALYNYSTSSQMRDSIVMMNGKYLLLTPTSIGDGQLATKNQLYENGVLFTVNNKVDYFPNVFEYLNVDSDFSSIASFLYGYNEYEFQESQSVPGDIKDGQTEYLDSVEVLKNKILDKIGLLNSEDSVYTMVVPDNATWERLVKEYTNYYQYDNTVESRDSLQELFARMAIVRGLVFSRTNNNPAALADSAMSTAAYSYSLRQSEWGSSDLSYYQYNKPFAEGGIFYDVDTIACSNGYILKPHSWNVSKYDTFMQQIIVEAENQNSQLEKESTRDPLNTYSVETSNRFYNSVSNHSFVEIRPATTASFPQVTFSIPQRGRNYEQTYNPGVLSNVPYDIYVVTVPAYAGLSSDSLATAEQRLPYKFRAALNYHTQDGSNMYRDSEWLTSEETGKTFFTTQPGVMDTVKVASNYVFPTCSAYLDDNTQVTLTIRSYVSSSEVRNSDYTKTMRLDCIILKPHEED